MRDNNSKPKGIQLNYNQPINKSIQSQTDICADALNAILSFNQVEAYKHINKLNNPALKETIDKLNKQFCQSKYRQNNLQTKMNFFLENLIIMTSNELINPKMVKIQKDLIKQVELGVLRQVIQMTNQSKIYTNIAQQRQMQLKQVKETISKQSYALIDKLYTRLNRMNYQPLKYDSMSLGLRLKTDHDDLTFYKPYKFQKQLISPSQNYHQNNKWMKKNPFKQQPTIKKQQSLKRFSVHQQSNKQEQQMTAKKQQNRPASGRKTSIQQENQSLKQEVKKIQEILKENSKKNNQTQINLQRQTKEKQEIMNKLTELQNDKKKIIEKNQFLKKENNQMKRLLDQKQRHSQDQAFERWRQAENQEVKQLKNKLQQFEKDNEETKVALQRVKQENKNYQSTLNQLNFEFDSCKQKSKEAILQNQRKTKELNVKIQEITEELNISNRRNQELTTLNEKLSEKINSLQANLHQKDKQMASKVQLFLKSQKTRKQTHDKVVTKLQTRIKGYQQQIDDLNHQMLVITNTYEELNKMNQSMQRRQDRNQNVIRLQCELQSAKSNASRLHSELQSANNNASRLHSELQSAKNENASQKNIIQQKKTTITNLKNEIKQTKEQQNIKANKMTQILFANNGLMQLIESFKTK